MYGTDQDVSHLSGLLPCKGAHLAVLIVPHAPAALSAPCQPPGAPSASGLPAFLLAETPAGGKQPRMALHRGQPCARLQLSLT